MKKIIAIILFFLYVIPAIGTNITVHYCGGEISSISLGSEGAKCGCGSKKMKMNCCKDKKITFKISDDQQKEQHLSINILKSFNLQSALVPNYIFNFQPVSIEKGSYCVHHPPDKVKPSLYILHQVFRI